MQETVEFDQDIAVLLPCYNEEKSIARVVIDFRKALPGTRVFVFDNNSTDNTAEQAARAGATVITCRRQGKGNVVRQMFADIDADIYIMADGDGTYDASAAPEMIEKMIADRADMLVATREDVTKDAGRKGHAFGNQIFNTLYRFIFQADFSDIFSGYRVFSRRFAKSFPADSHGFEIETEMSVHASMLRLSVSEIDVPYGRRVEGSHSKLSTFKDGCKILLMMLTLMKETRPFRFFGAISVGLAVVSMAFMIPVLNEYFTTGLVTRMPSWVLAMTLLLGSMMALMAGTILDSVARARAEQKRNFFLSINPVTSKSISLGDTVTSDSSARPALAVTNER